MDKRLITFIGDKLLEDVDVETEKIGLGKTLWDDIEIDDEGEEVAYIELYSEIPLEEINELSFELGTSLDLLIDEIKILVKENTITLLRYVFIRDKNLQDYNIDWKHAETFEELDKENELFVININLIAKPAGGDDARI